MKIKTLICLLTLLFSAQSFAALPSGQNSLSKAFEHRDRVVSSQVEKILRGEDIVIEGYTQGELNQMLAQLNKKSPDTAMKMAKLSCCTSDGFLDAINCLWAPYVTCMLRSGCHWQCRGT